MRLALLLLRWLTFVCDLESPTISTYPSNSINVLELSFMIIQIDKNGVTNIKLLVGEIVYKR